MPENSEDYPYFTPYTDNISYGYYHGYTLFDKEHAKVAYPFGFGLSYTSYSYEKLRVFSPVLNLDETLRVKVDIANTGDRAGEEVVQMYIGFLNSAVDRPVKLLRGFDKVLLQTGETRAVTMELAVSELAWYNPDEKEWQVEAMPYEVFVGGVSSEEALLRGSFVVQ